MLDIHLLGPPSVYLNGEKITIQRTATRALLFYLAATLSPVSRDQLSELLWSELNDERLQRRRLTTSLSFLRSIFPKIIETYSGTVGLARDALRVDMFEFSEAVEKMRKYAVPWQSGNSFPPALEKELIHASELWEGETFIDSRDMDVSKGISAWWCNKNEELQRARFELYRFLARLKDARGKPHQAVLYAEKTLLLDEYDEAAHLVLMDNLRKVGQVGRAKQHYLDLEKREGGDLSGVFSEKLRAMGKALFQQMETSSIHVRPTWVIHSSAPSIFVGQEDTLQLLRRNYHAGVGTLILGEAGAGKTRLVQEFYKSLDLPPCLLLIPCSQPEENLPYQPWIDMLRRSFDRDFWKKAPASWAKPLGMLLPELHEIRDDLGEAPTEGYAASQVFNAIRNLLTFIHQETSYLLVIEDAHWADNASLSLLAYLMQQAIFDHPNMGLIITSRLEEKNLPLDELVQFSMQRIEIIELLCLKDEDVAQLAFYVLQEALPPAILSRLREQTGGNPFILLEVLQYHLLRGEQDSFNKLGIHAIPPSVKRLVELRIDKLSTAARDLLLLAAVQGSPFELAILEKAENLSLEKLSEIIGELEEAHLVYAVDQDAGLKYAFVHEIFCEELVASLQPVQKRVYHKKVAEALEALLGGVWGAKAAVLAEHYEKAGAFSKAFGFWMQAAQYATRLFSKNDAQTAYLHAEGLIDKTPLEEEEIYDLYESWGSMLFDSDDHDLLEDIMQRLLTIGQERNSNLLVGVALDGMSSVFMSRNQFSRGLEYVKEAIPLLDKSGVIPAQMNASIHQSVFTYMMNDFSAAKAIFQKVLDLGEGRTDPASVYCAGHANYQMATILTGMGEPAKAIDHAKASFQKIRLSGFPHGMVLPYSIMGLANYYLANYEEGRQHALQCIKLATQADNWRMLGYAASYAGMNEVEIGELGEAWHHAHQAINLGQKHGHTEIVSMGYKVLGDVYTRLDALSQAAKVYHLGTVVDVGSFASLENLARFALTLGLLGDPEGDAQLEQALAHAEAAGLQVIEINAKASALNLLLQRGQHEDFLEKVDQIREELTKRSHPQSFVWIDYLHALSLFQRGELDEALVCLEKTLPILENSPFLWIKPRAYQLHVSLLQALGRDPEIPRAKIETILSQLEKTIGDAPIKKEWKTFTSSNRII